MRKSLLLTLLLLAGFVSSQGQVVGPTILSQSFDGTTFPPTGWTTVAASTGLAWNRVTAGSFPSQSPHSGAGEAQCNSFSVSSGSTDLITPALNFNYAVGGVAVSFWMYRDNGYVGTADKVDVMVNTTASATGATTIGTVNRSYSLSPVVSSVNGWYQYTFTVPASYNTATNYIIFRGTSVYGNDIYMDDVLIYRNLPSTPPPPIVISNATPPNGVCSGGSVTITGTDPNGYPSPTFTLTGPCAGSVSPNPNTTGIFTIPNVTPACAGTYNVTLTSGAITSNVGSVVVNVFPVYTIAITNIVTTSSCTSADGGFTITGVAPSTSYNVSWVYNGSPVNVTLSSTASGTIVVAGRTAGTYTNVSVKDPNLGSCASNNATAVIPVPNPPATPTGSSNQPLCPNTTLTLTITSTPIPGATYTWKGPGNFNATGTTVTRPNMNASYNGNYTVELLTSNGCPSLPSNPIVVTMTAKDAKPGVASPLVFCQYEVTLPLSPTGPGYTWYGPFAGPNSPSGLGPDSSKISRPSITPRTDIATTNTQGIVYGVVYNVTCPSDTAYVVVQVKPRPAKPTVPGGTVEYCQFSPASPLAASGVSIRWFATPTGGVGSATAPTPNTLVSGTYFYYASQTVNGCESERAVIAVNVKPKPAPPTVTSPLNLCQGDPVGPLTAIGQNLLWYTAPTLGVGVPVAPIPNTGYEDSFKYWVSQTVNGCESDRALIAAYVNYKPNGIIVGRSQWVCQDANDTFDYYGNGRPDAQYVWSSPFPQSHSVGGNNSPRQFIVHFDSAGTAVIRLQINNKGCISTLIAAPITVRHLPVIDFKVKRDVCDDELVDISLLSTEPGISNFMFDFGSSDTTLVYSAPPAGPFGVRYHTPGDYIVSATATLNECTSKPLEKRITVHELPNATITASNRDLSKEVCASDTLVLSVLPVGEGATYVWTPKAYFQAKEDTLNYIVRAVVNQSAMVRVIVTSAFGCESRDSIPVLTKPCCGVFFPTAFAPEGNVEKNKRFKPITIGFHQANNFRVINRWGQVVYETKTEPHGDYQGWDGIYNGVKQDMGVYFYYYSYKCEGKNVEEHGEVTLMR
jgi:hypothetical protein